MTDLLNVDETSPWIRLDLNYWAPLTQGRTPVLFRKRSIIFHQEEPPEYVYIIKSGRARVTSFQPDGAEKQIYIAEEGAMCGESSCAQRHPHTASAVAIVDTLVYCLPYREVEAAMRTDWELTQRVMQVICRKNNILFKQVMELSFSQSVQRVAQVLLNLARQYGSAPEADGRVQINLKFTHQDVASMINTSRVTVSNIFNMLTEEAVLTKVSGFFVLLDMLRLQQLSIGL